MPLTKNTQRVMFDGGAGWIRGLAGVKTRAVPLC